MAEDALTSGSSWDRPLNWRSYEADMMGLCEMKAEEFRLLGYEEVTAQDVWDCVREQLKGEVRLHEVVSQIAGLHVDKFMNRLTIRAYKGQLEDDPFAHFTWRVSPPPES